MPSLQNLADSLPSYASDIALNLASVVAETILTEQQKWGCFVASAQALAVPPVVKAIDAAADEAGLAPAAKLAARGAAAIMAQNNVYFRAIAIMKNHQEYRALRARLRMRIVSNPGVPKDDFDLWCVAVSAINGCADCLDAHEGSLRGRGVEPVAVQTAMRIAAVVHAVSHVVAGEAASV